jgi:23S rRNA pseudouridine1911/1915/1917 synthase
MPEIIYEDKNLLVVNKPAGLIVHTAKDSEEAALTTELLKKYPELAHVGDEPLLRPGIVHRLDKETSGVMLVARTQESFEYLKSLFQKHEVQKTYLAIVIGEPKKKEGIIDAPIGIRNGTMKRSIRSARMVKPAITEYKVLKIFTREDGRGKENKFSLVEVCPKTGRTHQIRVHLASIGHSIVGDRLYGPKVQPEWAVRTLLHALSIEFTGMDGKRMKFEAEPPEDFEKAAKP